MDKPKQRGTNKPKSMSPGRQQKQSAKENAARAVADKSRHSGGSKPRAPRGR